MTYKFRSEALVDIENLNNILLDNNIEYTKFTPTFDEVEFVIEAKITLKDIDLDQLRNYMREVVDGHVMVQTVMPIEKYTGIRNYEL